MAVTHSNTIRNSLANLVVDAIDTPAGAGKIIFTGGVYPAITPLIATLTFDATAAFGDANAGSNPVGRCTANAIAQEPDATAGTVTQFHVQTFAQHAASSGTIFSGSVSQVGGAGDIVLSSTVIGESDTISITSLTYTSSV